LYRRKTKALTPKFPDQVKHKLLIVIAGASLLAMSPLGAARNANAQSSAGTPGTAVEMPPPTGEVLPPAASTVPPDSQEPSAPAVSLPKTSTQRARVKTTSIKNDSTKAGNAGGDSTKGDSKDSPDSNSPFAGLEGGSNHGPINIKSEKMSFDYKNNAVVFVGHVHAVQSGSELTTDTLHVQMNKQSQIQEMIAEGNVRMSQGQRWATGDHAVLDENVHTLILTGSPVVHDGNDQIAGTKITVYLQTGKSEVADPKAVIFPRESKKPNNSDTTTATDPAH
jgi:lipopolysaccharide export system protein LptA